MRPFATLVALLSLAGCSLFDGEPAEVGFTLTIPTRAPADVDVAATLDGRDVALSEQPTTGERLLYAEPISVGAGSTAVSCSVSDGSNQTRGEVDLDLTGGWRYSVWCAVADGNPIALCFGCSGSETFALDPRLGFAATDSLFVVWSESDPDHPVFYSPTSG